MWTPACQYLGWGPGPCTSTETAFLGAQGKSWNCYFRISICVVHSIQELWGKPALHRLPAGTAPLSLDSAGVSCLGFSLCGLLTQSQKNGEHLIPFPPYLFSVSHSINNYPNEMLSWEGFSVGPTTTALLVLSAAYHQGEAWHHKLQINLQVVFEYHQQYSHLVPWTNTN